VKVCIRLFAVASQLAGRDSIVLQMPAGSTVAQLRARLAADVPALAAVLPHIAFAVGSEYAQDDWVVSEGSEVACIPPVSGG
jgi:molybdopterin converting factor subunit 1